MNDDLQKLKDGEPCNHKGCINHITHPCEVCGRIAGQKQYDLQKLNREVVKWLGLCWHEMKENPAYRYDERACHALCSCGEPVFQWCDWKHSNPNYILHPEELLREMMKREDWSGDNGFQQTITPCDSYCCIDPDYITDQTGLLLMKVGEWMRKEEANEP